MNVESEKLAGSQIFNQSSTRRFQSLEVYIEELVLHGFEPRDRYRIGEAIQRELTRLFADQGVPPSLAQGGELARVDGGMFDVASGSKSDAIGAQVARAVYRGLDAPPPSV